MAAQTTTHLVKYFNDLVGLIPDYRTDKPEELEFLDETETKSGKEKKGQKNKGKQSNKKIGKQEDAPVDKSKAKNEHKQKKAKALETDKPLPATGPRQGVGVGSAKDITELRQKMQERINQLKRKRGDMTTGQDKSKRMKRREEKASKKKEAIKKNGGKDESESAKKKKKSSKKDTKADKPKSVNSKKQEANAEAKRAKTTSASVDPSQAEAQITDLQFSSIADPKAPVSAKAPKRIKGGKDALALKKVQRFEQKVQELKETDADKAEQVVRGAAVSSALLRASGVKVQDNKKMLQKSLKRKEKSKQKSQTMWKARSKEAALGAVTRVQEGKERRNKAKNKVLHRVRK